MKGRIVRRSDQRPPIRMQAHPNRPCRCSPRTLLIVYLALRVKKDRYRP
jgi:hypothetical protein